MGGLFSAIFGGGQPTQQQTQTTTQSSTTNAQRTVNVEVQNPGLPSSQVAGLISAASQGYQSAASQAQSAQAQLLSAITANSEVANTFSSGAGAVNSITGSLTNEIGPLIEPAVMVGILILIGVFILNMTKAVGGK
jgi:hypothetical protein